MDGGRIVAVLLPDGKWHEIEPGTYRSWSRTASGEATEGRFMFREDSDLVSGPLSSVLATRARDAPP